MPFTHAPPHPTTNCLPPTSSSTSPVMLPANGTQEMERVLTPAHLLPLVLPFRPVCLSRSSTASPTLAPS
jgi:hypothetical protein